MARLPRPHMSLSVKLAACIDALGHERAEDVSWPRQKMTLTDKLDACLGWLGFQPGDVVEWDHVWALGLRERTPDGGYIPDANDPRYIRPRLKEVHARKTRGSGATTAGSDVHRIAKVRRIIRKREEPAKPKRKIKSRGFEKRPANGWR